MIDTVYVTRDGENPELRYSLRSLSANVVTGTVFLFGGAPRWFNHDAGIQYRRPQLGSAYMTTRAHIAAALNKDEVSDPFMLWNDDFFAMRRMGPIPIMHRGLLMPLVETYRSRNTPWAKGMIEAAAMLGKRGYTEALSYDTHVPLIIHKDAMREALQWAKTARADAIHLRTLYGNFAELGGEEIEDPKMIRGSDPFPRGAWLSSSDNTFRSTVEPVLRYMFPDPSPYEMSER